MEVKDLQEAAVAEIELTDREVAIAQGRDPDQETDSASTEATKEVESGSGIEGRDSGQVRGEEAGKEVNEAGGKDAAPSPDWLSEDERTLGESYGFTDDDLKQFGSREEFRRAATLFDRHLARQKPPVAEIPAEKPAEKQVEKLAVEAKASEARPDDLDPEQYAKAGYDEETVKLVKFAKQQAEQVRALQERFAREDQARAEFAQHEALERFHDTVDGLDSERYGRSVDDAGKYVKLDKSHDDNRRKLYEAHATIVAGIVQRASVAGTQPQLPNHKALLQRAEMLAFGQEIANAERKKHQQGLQDQSKRRRSVAAVRPVQAARDAEYVNPIDAEVARVAAKVGPKWSEMVGA